ncbi:urea carboxylase-associated protein 2 [Oxalobacteraceae bacterium GrIS 1.18]
MSSHSLLPADLDPAQHLWSEELPGGAHWSYVVKRGTTIRCTDLEGMANLSILVYNADERLERLNIPDTLKAQHTAHLTQGNVLYSDMGRVLASISADTVGWHDPLCGVADAAQMAAKYGQQRYQEQRNAMQRNGRDSLLIEIGKWGMGLRDLVPTLNLFSKVIVKPGGALEYVANHSGAGDYVELRFEMNTLLALSSAPHPLDTSPVYQPKKIALVAWHSGTAAEDDACRLHCPENQRGFANTEQYYR